MTIIELLERNAREWPNDTALVEINPDQPETRRVTWHDFELVEPSAKQKHYRREITWAVFDEKANRVANMLRSHGIGKGKKVAILMMNCIDWLPIYFGILKTGAVVVPMNFRYASNEIEYCLNLSESNMLIFGPEFIGRIEEIADKIPHVALVFEGPGCPSFADDLMELIGPQKLQGVDTSFDFPDGDYSISADRVQIHQVLLNITLNALDAMSGNPPERPRKLSLAFGAEADSPLTPAPPPDFKRAGEYVFIAVVDTGCGIDAETQKRIFEPFFTTKPIGSGTGMGLAMAYGAVSNHRGWIQLSSAPGKGSTFVLFLPRSGGENEKQGNVK